MSHATSRELLLTASGHDCYVAIETAGHQLAAVDVRQDAYGWTTRNWAPDTDWTTVLGSDPDAIAACAASLLGRAVRDGRPTDGLTVSRAGAARSEAVIGWRVRGQWEWWSTTQAPPRVAGEADVVDVAADDPALAELLQAWSPRRSVEADDPTVSRWVGVYGGVGLVAVAADTRHRPAVPHLAGVVTAGPSRGQGLAAALCAVLTRDALAAGAPVVTLSMYSDNAAARAVYTRLGFAVGHAFSSGTLRGDRPEPR